MDLDLLPTAETGLGAPLGLMSAPGTRRDLDADLAELCDLHRAALLVSLVGEHELAMLRIPDLVPRARTAGLDLVRFPIADFSTPAAPEDLIPLVDRILAVTQHGGAVVVHCWAGRGRSGLVAASCLAARGMDAGDAIALVRRHRRGAVETPEQEEFVGALYRVFRAR